MRVRVIHGIDDLANDLAAISMRVRPDMREVVRDGIRAGAELSKGYAKRSAGAHGKHYHRAISSEMHGGLGLFGNTTSGEWGPDANKKQGGMSFERGSVNQPPHNDLAKSADIIGPQFPREVGDKVDRWFW